MLRLKGAAGDAASLYHDGQLSENAYRIAQALEEADGPLETGVLRKAAGFPTGKEQRAAYLKAVEELEGYMVLAKLFSPDDDDMRHGLVRHLRLDEAALRAGLDRLVAAGRARMDDGMYVSA